MAVWAFIGPRSSFWTVVPSSGSPIRSSTTCSKSTQPYGPVAIGVETNGLEEFLMQPLRHEMIKRGAFIPIVGYRAPRNKLQFIAALQSFMHAVTWYLPRISRRSKQFLSFPTGRIDFPNALAYALQMRPTVVYEDFA